jgi:hypothetical protein
LRFSLQGWQTSESVTGYSVGAYFGKNAVKIGRETAAN